MESKSAEELTYENGLLREQIFKMHERQAFLLSRIENLAEQWESFGSQSRCRLCRAHWAACRSASAGELRSILGIYKNPNWMPLPEPPGE